MTLSVYVTPEAKWNADDITLCLAERNEVAAWRFADAVDAMIEMLCRNPELGERLHADPMGQIRYRTISGFTNYLIFYRRVDSVLEVVRILHGARDYEPFFE
jgi:toxin ParE1/3/4